MFFLILLLILLCLAAPFAFVFFLIYAIRDAVKDGKRTILYGIGASISLILLFVILYFRPCLKNREDCVKSTRLR